MRFDILTLFPEMFEGVLSSSMLRIAVEKGLAEYVLHDFREFAKGFHRKADDRPFGGGPGMIIKPEPVIECLEALLGEDHAAWPPLLVPGPAGERYNQKTAMELSELERVVILCGHYEGFDQRIFDALPVREISLGDYVLTGGELPALVLVDSVVRLLPGVLGDSESVTYESFNDGRLDHPHYTRPVSFRGLEVPEVLRSGDHARIAEWRRRESERLTRERRPDLLEGGDD